MKLPSSPSSTSTQSFARRYNTPSIIEVPIRSEWTHVYGKVDISEIYCHKMSVSAHEKFNLYGSVDGGDYKLLGQESLQVFKETRGAWFKLDEHPKLPSGLHLNLSAIDGADQYQVFFYLDRSHEVLKKSERALSIEIPKLSFVVAPQSYRKNRPPRQLPFNLCTKPQLEIGIPAISLVPQKAIAQRSTLCMDLGSYGNTLVAVNRRSQSTPCTPITAPHIVGDTYERVELSESGEVKVTSRFSEHLEGQQACSFSSSFIKNHESVGPVGHVIGERADKILSDGSLTHNNDGFSWSVKSNVDQGGDLYKSWLSTIFAGLVQKVPLLEGKARKTRIKSSEYQSSPNMVFDKIFCSHPNTWLEPKRKSLQSTLGQAFGLKDEQVIIDYDEATAGSIGWFVSRLGEDMNPNRLLSLMSEETLFQPLKPKVDQHEGLSALAALSEPLHILVFDTGAGTTDIALLKVAYDHERDEVIAKTLGRQGFNAGGLEISRELCKEWKRSLFNRLRKYADVDDQDVKDMLITNIESTDHVSAQEVTRRNNLLVNLYACAELVKQMSNFQTEEHTLQLNSHIKKIHEALNAYIGDQDLVTLELLESVIKFEPKQLNRICIKILGPGLYSASDLPVQHGIKRLNAILMLGRTLRLPNLTEAFIYQLREKARETERETGEDWSMLVPPPHNIHSWNQDKLLQRQFNADSDLSPDEDKRCVSLGLAMIAACRERGIEHFSFEPQDKKYRQRFIGAGNLNRGSTWHHTIVHGVEAGQPPIEFNEDDETLYTLSSVNSDEFMDIFWNNLGVTHESTTIKISGEEYMIEREPIIKLGRIGFKKVGQDLPAHSRFNIHFKLIEDGRVRLDSVEVLSPGEEPISFDCEEPNRSERLSQKVNAQGCRITYDEESYDPDFRNSGIIDELLDHQEQAS